MLNLISNYFNLTPAFHPCEHNFWNDEHISKYLLEAHLAPNFDGASRHPEIIEQSVAWIKELANPRAFPNLLDIGCGPGLYTERFAKLGYNVTGIDFSKRSINYAKNSAHQQGLDIKYSYQNYLELDEENAFEIATLIYCDYGALSKIQRSQLLKKLYAALKREGILILDTFTKHKYQNFPENQLWQHHPNGGFWNEDDHIVISKNQKYPELISLEQSLVITQENVKNYLIWHQYFTQDLLIKEANEAGFTVVDIFDDITGKTVSCNNDTLAIVLKK